MKIEDMRFTVLVVGGEISELCDLETQVLRYEPLSWSDAVELARLSFMQGYEVVLWRIDEGDE